jgi:hypothetical protein
MLLPRTRRGPGAAAGTTIGAGSRDRGASGARVVAAGRRARGGVEAFSQPRRAFPAPGIPGGGHSGRERRWRGRALFGADGGELMARNSRAIIPGTRQCAGMGGITVQSLPRILAASGRMTARPASRAPGSGISSMTAFPSDLLTAASTGRNPPFWPPRRGQACEGNQSTGESYTAADRGQLPQVPNSVERLLRRATNFCVAASRQHGGAAGRSPCVTACGSQENGCARPALGAGRARLGPDSRPGLPGCGAGRPCRCAPR